MKTAIATVAAAVAGMLVLVVLLGAGFASDTTQPSPTAVSEIPPNLLRAYTDAANTCPGLTWDVLAAIGYLESRHADGRADPITGDVQPPIVGPPLDGRDGRATITDPSEPDGWAHAHGPMQFLKTTWAQWAVLAPQRPDDATPDYDNAYDSIYTAANYLCGPEHRIDDLRAALLRYNPSDSYVEQVLDKATSYRTLNSSNDAASIIGTHALPLPRTVFDEHPEYLAAPHHDYPAIDIPVPVGTPVFAVASGRVVAVTPIDSSCGNGIVIDADDGYRYTYCHGSFAIVSASDEVIVGQVLMLSGNTGASSGPHLHLEIAAPAGELICPQPLLANWYTGSDAPLPTTSIGCVA